MPNVHIVVPTFEHYQLLHELLWNLYRKERENIASILVVDDCSQDDDEETTNGLKWWQADWKEKNNTYPINVIRNETNLGFLRSSNLGLQMLSELDKEDIAILISTDVQINGKFISQICDIIDGNSSSMIGGVLYQHDTGWNTFEGRTFPYLEGWLLATTVQNWEQLDYFDEQFSPSDFEDVDISTKAISMGMELVPLNNPGLHHIGGQTIGYNPERLEITNRNKEKFRKKWIG